MYCHHEGGCVLLRFDRKCVCVCNERALAWDDKERSALNVSSFKVFEQPLELTNRGRGEQ